MPFINRRGEWCAGRGGAEVSIGVASGQGVVVVPFQSATGGWIDDDTLIAQLCAGESCKVVSWNRTRGIEDRLLHGANDLVAGGGNWAVWYGPDLRRHPDHGRFSGVTTGTGLRFPISGLGSMGPDGEVAIKVDYQSWGPWIVVARDGTQWSLTNGDAVNINLLGNRRAFFLGSDGYHFVGIPQGQIYSSPAWWIKVVEIAGDWWILYQRSDGALVLHPFDSPQGYIVAPSGSLTYRPDVVALNGGARIVWATSEEESYPRVVVVHQDLSRPRTDIRVSVTPEPEPEPEQPMYRSGQQIKEYLEKRWRELGIPAKVDAIKRETGFTTNKQMEKIREDPNASAADKARQQAAYAKFRAIQIPASFEIHGEMYHKLGWKDVGLGRKTSGNNWEGKATDITVLKPIDSRGNVVAGQVLQADSLSASGYPESGPMWKPIDFNPARTWVEPDVPTGHIPIPDPAVTHKYIGGGNDRDVCDVETCKRSRFDPIHKIPEAEVPHGWDPGENGAGLCDVCQKPEDDQIHRGDSVERHKFESDGTGKCRHCGEPEDNLAFHFEREPSEPGNGEPAPIGNLDETNKRLDAMIAQQKITNEKLDALRIDVTKAIKDFGDALDGGILDILRRRE